MTPTTATATDVLVSYNPATGEPVGEVPVTPAVEIAAVVARARAAQPAWQALGINERAKLLRAAAPRLVERADEIGALLTRRMAESRKFGAASSIA